MRNYIIVNLLLLNNSITEILIKKYKIKIKIIQIKYKTKLNIQK